MEMLLWIGIGAVAGVAAAFAFPAVPGIGRLGTVAIACVAAFVGGIATDVLVGDVARLSVSLIATGVFGTVYFGLAPAIAAAIAATVALGSLQRIRRGAPG